MTHTKDAETVCPVCSACLKDNAETIPYPDVNRVSEFGDDFKQIRFCCQCGLGVVYPDIDDQKLARYYNNGGFWVVPKPHFLFRQAVVSSLLGQSRWKSIEEALARSHINRKIRILDIGAGYGFIGLHAARSTQFELSLYTCVEPDYRMRDYLVSIWEKYSRKGSLEVKSSLEDVIEKFEVVVLSHVLEHVKDPLGMLRKAVSFLSESGVVLIDVPNRDYSFKKNVFPHLIFFDHKSLEYAVREEGLLSLENLFGYGTDAKYSPLNKNPPLGVRLASGMLRIGQKLMPHRQLAFLFERHYGINRINPQGTWLRAIARKLPNNV